MINIRNSGIAFFLLLTCAPPAAAQVYRCERDGKVAFSDQPCDAGAKVSRKDYATSAASSALDMRLVVTHYSVEGLDYGSLADSLRAKGPNGFHGLASWNVSFEYTSKKLKDACEIAALRLKVVGDILMPKWTDESSAPAQLQRRWTGYYAALKLHEDGHVQHGRELAVLVNERLMRLGAVPCDQLQALARAEYQRVYDNLKTRDQEYDARTGHGKTQGAVF